MNTIHEKYVKREDDFYHKYKRLMGAFLEVFLAGTPETQKKVDAIKKQLCSEYTEEHKVFVKYKYNDTVSQSDYTKHFSKLEFLIATYTRLYEEVKGKRAVTPAEKRPATPTVTPSVTTVEKPSLATKPSSATMDIGAGYRVPEDHTELLRFVDSKISELDKAEQDLSSFLTVFKAEHNAYHVPAGTLLNRIRAHREECKKLKSTLTLEWTDHKLWTLRAIFIPIDTLTAEVDKTKKNETPLTKSQIPDDEWGQRRIFNELIGKLDAIVADLKAYDKEYKEKYGHFKYKVGDLCISIINRKKYFSEQFNKKWVDKKELILQLSSCVQQNTKNASFAKNGLG